MDTIKKVFISHINEERDVALALQELIYAQLSNSVGGKIECCLSSDKWQWKAGEDWMKRIKAELAMANVVLLMLSPQSLTRHWVNLEGGAAWVTDRLMIPVIYSGLKIGSVPRPYSDFSAVDLEDDPYQLLRTLGEKLFYPPPLLPDHEAYTRLREALAQNLERISKLK